jgi:tetratricopeptide (TPR) repeat protein
MRFGNLATVIATLIFIQPAMAANKKEAQDCSQSGDFDRMISGCTQALESKTLADQLRATAYKVRGDGYRGKGDYDRAIADYNEVIRIDSGNVSALNARGIAYSHVDNLDRAIADFSEAIRINPKYAFAYLNRGIAFKDKGDPDRAIADYDDAIRNYPRYAFAYFNRGKVYYNRADYDRAIVSYNEAIRNDPRDLDAYSERSAAYYLKHEIARTTADNNKQMEIRESIRKSKRGSVYSIAGDDDRAIADISGAIHIDPKNATVYNDRGGVYGARGDYDRAIADFSEAVRIDPRNSNAYTSRADAYSGKGDYDRAVMDYGEAIRLNSVDVAAFAGRGLAYEKIGKAAEAHVDFDAALAIPQKSESEKLAQERVRENLAALSDTPASAATVATAPSPAATEVVATAAPGTVTDHRIALVIGNSAYENVPALANPARDAAFVADTLKRTGFESVTVQTNLRKDALITALRSFAARADNADWAVVYYAGHGMEVRGINYLIPIDAKIAADRDIGFEAVPLEQVLNAAERARKLRLVILDACRDNPFASQMKRTLSVASRSVTRGLAAVEPDAGTLVVYAAKDGETAIDGEGSNSPFALAFVKNLQTPGLEVRRLFDFVRDDVMEATGRKQQPFSYGSISGKQDFYFVAGK